MNTVESLIGQNYVKAIIHMFDQSPTVNYIILLVKWIAEKYVDIRLKHFASTENNTATIRKQLSKIFILEGN